MFVINGAFYAASAPFVGMLCDRKVNPKLLILAGSAFMVFSVLLVGPAPFIPIEKWVSSDYDVKRKNLKS